MSGSGTSGPARSAPPRCRVPARMLINRTAGPADTYPGTVTLPTFLLLLGLALGAAALGFLAGRGMRPGAGNRTGPGRTGTGTSARQPGNGSTGSASRGGRAPRESLATEEPVSHPAAPDGHVPGTLTQSPGAGQDAEATDASSHAGDSDPVVSTGRATGTGPVSESVPVAPEALDDRICSLLGALPGIVIVVDAKGTVLMASDEARRQHLVVSESLTNDEIAGTAAICLQQGRNLTTKVTVLRPPLRRGRLDVRVNAISLQRRHAVLLLDDLTEETRINAVRRDFIANVSHELKTPVGAMSLLSEALVAASDDPESVEHFAVRLQMEAQRLSALINDVIDLSRLQGDDPMPNPHLVNVNDLVQRTMDSVSSRAELKDIRIIVATGQQDWVVGDMNQLTIALTNLLTNAIAYSDAGTQIAIAVRHEDGSIAIDVKDQGIGIPFEEQDRVFERFYRIDEARSRSTGGTGLGLAIVRNVCRNHGGDVSLWSVESEGSTFTMRLPLPDAKTIAELSGTREDADPEPASGPGSEPDPTGRPEDPGQKPGLGGATAPGRLRSLATRTARSTREHG